MEHKAKYHGSALPEADAAKALGELGLDNPIPLYRERANTFLALTRASVPRARFRDRSGGNPYLRGRGPHRQSFSLWGGAGRSGRAKQRR